MGYLKDIQTNLDIQAFPGATFEAAGEIPNTQCAEAQIESAVGQTFNFVAKLLLDANKFIGYDLTGKVCTITASVGGNIGDFDIDSNTDDSLNLAQDPGNGNPVTYHVHDGGELEITRDVASLAAFIHAAGYSYTFKGGKLYTNIPSAQLQPACTITFDPLT